MVYQDPECQILYPAARLLNLYPYPNLVDLAQAIVLAMRKIGIDCETPSDHVSWLSGLSFFSWRGGRGGGFGFVRFRVPRPFVSKFSDSSTCFSLFCLFLLCSTQTTPISGISFFICHRGLPSYRLLLTSWFSLSDKLWLDNQQPHHHRPSSLNKKSLSSTVPGSTTVINGGSTAECFMFDQVIASLIYQL
jgi:hypothetical protein